MKNFILHKAQFNLLAPLTTECLQSCLEKRQIRLCDYKKGASIHIEADPCYQVELILSGQVIVERIDESGYLMTITSFGPNEILGANLIFSDKPFYPMTVTARSDATLLAIEKDLLFQLCATNPSFLMVFLAYISNHTLVLGDKIKHFAHRSIRESLYAFFKSEMAKQNSSVIILPMSKKALADRIGIQRTSLSRELQKMKNEGLIDYNGFQITILKAF